MKAYERLINYAKVWTTSVEDAECIPSSDRELVLARQLVKELKDLGIKDAWMDEHGYVYGSLAATPGKEDVPALAFISHMDTAPDASGENVKPQLIPDYNGEDIELGHSGKYLTLADFPHLASLKGRTLITTDGTTLLGADDKAGIAEIMTVLETLIHGDAPHGKICVAFTPDEEIGSGAEELQLDKLGAVYGYTVDGSEEGEIQYENFNAANAVVKFHGKNVHTGSAKNIMINAAQLAVDFHAALPEKERPECTEGYEGFYHLYQMDGCVEETTLHYLLRNFTDEGLAEQKYTLQKLADEINTKYPAGTAEVEIKDSYSNMKQKIEPCMWLIEYAVKACEKAAVKPLIVPIRGGTDGARLSFRGLPCPNLGTGGYAFHGIYEHITVEGMDKTVEILLGIIAQFCA